MNKLSLLEDISRLKKQDNDIVNNLKTAVRMLENKEPFGGALKVYQEHLDKKANQFRMWEAIEQVLIQGNNYLDLSNFSLDELPSEVLKISQLIELNLSNNNISSLPDNFGDLEKLSKLTLSRNSLIKLPTTINQLQKLRYLDVSDNALELIPSELGELTELLTLKLSNNKLKSLPNKLILLNKLIHLDVSGNDLKIPPEITKKTREPRAILDFYSKIYDAGITTDLPNDNTSKTLTKENASVELPKISRHTRAVNEVKLLIVGQGSVGKTSLINQLLQGKFSPNQAKTDGISIARWQIEGGRKQNAPLSKWTRISSRNSETSSITLNIWDFGGQEIMHATHQFFLTKRSLYLLVLDSRLSQEENRVEYWLKIIQSFGGESPVLIVGNKTDQHPLDLDRAGLKKKYPNIVGIFETSAATGIGISALKNEIEKLVLTLPHVHDLLPETWFVIKKKLEDLSQIKNFFTLDEYLSLCTTNEIIDETGQSLLIGFLHDLGVVLHFQEDRRLAELGILNPQWVTNGVYKILNDKILFAHKGVLALPLLDKILSTAEYPQNKRLFIVEMMRKFELCYDIDRETFLIPDLLPKDQPDLKFNGIPAFEYAYPVLPSSVITRFIVRMNQKINDGLVWRTGVVLKIGENKALVKADIEDRKITIAIEGVEHTRRDALSAIRYQLDEIHNSIKGLNPEKFVPIPRAESQRYEFLLQLEHDGVKVLPVPGKGGGKPIMLDISQLLSGIESEAQRRENVTNVTTIYHVNTGGGDFTGRDKSISASESSVVVGGNMSGNLISGNYNKINSAEISSELRDTMLQLGEAVDVMIEKLPAEQAVEVAEDFGKLADEAVKPKPNQKWYSVSIDGLIKAAENLDKLGPPVISLSRKVLSMLTGGLVK